MASLKDMRNRIASVQATQKITKAMQMVAAAKLRRAQDAAQNARPYARRMSAVIANLAAGVEGKPGAPELLVGTGRDDKHLIVVATSDRGLAGGFNSSIVRAARERINQLLGALLENQAGFYASQMAAMDNATRNAGDMIKKQTQLYNRSRQAMITKELIEIISGAEAL